MGVADISAAQNADVNRSVVGHQLLKLKQACPYLVVSFTPGFSRVAGNGNMGGNRLNGLPTNVESTVTWLKPGVTQRSMHVGTHASGVLISSLALARRRRAYRLHHSAELFVVG
jgi:hypothetical protein